MNNEKFKRIVFLDCWENYISFYDSIVKYVAFWKKNISINIYQKKPKNKFQIFEEMDVKQNNIRNNIIQGMYEERINENVGLDLILKIKTFFKKIKLSLDKVNVNSKTKEFIFPKKENKEKLEKEFFMINTLKKL